jgi:hypothetical protein
MKKEQKKAIIQDCISKEDFSTIYENVIFTEISTEDIVSSPMCYYGEMLDLISVFNGLKCRFGKNVVAGNAKDIKKAHNILINSVKYN